MPNSRYRLEGNTRASEVETGLQTRIGDALWMLARQWQVGEFRGEDAASPVQARFQVATLPLSSMHSFRSRTFTPIDPLVPLEAYAEQQPPGDLGGFWRSAESGMHLLRLLSAGGLDSLRKTLRVEYALTAPAAVEAEERAWVDLLVRRSCDGERIYRERSVVLPLLRRQIAVTLHAAFEEATNAWIAWHEDRLMTRADLDCWDSDRMEYRFHVRAQGDAGAVALEAREYPGGHLDWYNFDLTSSNWKPEQTNPLPEVRTVFPTPVQFAGMPASRWWEFEDGSVNFGDVNSSAVDFARMITSAFATTYGDDWFAIPVKVPIGSLARITSLVVQDSFGDVTSVGSIGASDGVDRVWRYFELNGDRGDPVLFVPAMALGRLQGTSIETVTLIRDETENLAWGIESTYEGALERVGERGRAWAAMRPEAAAAGEPDLWSYRLLNPVPPHWIPFVPVRSEGSSQIRLRRGRMSEWDLLPDSLVGIRGQTLLPNPHAPLLIHEEEIPASGIEITRAYQFARQVGGRSFVWLGGRKRPAKPHTPMSRDTDAVIRNTK